MKNSKKFLSAILASAMILTLTACNDGSAPSNPLDSLNSDKSSTGEATKSSSTTSEVNNPQIDPDTIAVFPSDDFEYKYNNEFGGFEITRYIGKSSIVNIPDKINGEMVVAIGEDAFYGYTELISITISNGVKKIGESAFCDCTGLTSITIPNSVTGIGTEAFSYCEGLTSVTIPNSVTEICAWALGGCTAEVTYKGKTYTSDDKYDALYKAING